MKRVYEIIHLYIHSVYYIHALYACRRYLYTHGQVARHVTHIMCVDAVKKSRIEGI